MHANKNHFNNQLPFLIILFFTLFFTACSEDDPNIIDDQNEVSDNETEEEIDGEVMAYTVLVQTPDLPATPYNYANPNVPNHFNQPNVINEDNTPNNNPVTNLGATLGRVLFFDKNLSRNNTIACASCHKQSEGFSDHQPFSMGFEGGFTGRNSMGLTNAKYYENGHYFWDERAGTLEIQTLMPIQDGTEMGMNLATLEAKLRDIPYYASLFVDAFGDDEITADRVSLALAQYVRAIVAYNTKFDAGLTQLGNNVNLGNTPFPNFTDSENLGKQLFFSNRTNCDNCHSGVNFVTDRPENNGLDIVYEDNGVGSVTGNTADNGKFKINSLRNVEHTAPYMHDGRFSTLEEVVEFYNNGIQPHPNLAPELRQGPPGNPGGQVVPRRMNLTLEERTAIVDFLKTLTDNQLLSDIKFSDPFE